MFFIDDQMARTDRIKPNIFQILSVRRALSREKKLQNFHFNEAMGRFVKRVEDTKKLSYRSN